MYSFEIGSTLPSVSQYEEVGSLALDKIFYNDNLIMCCMYQSMQRLGLGIISMPPVSRHLYFAKIQLAWRNFDASLVSGGCRRHSVCLRLSVVGIVPFSYSERSLA